jgi:hypothetical protein
MRISSARSLLIGALLGALCSCSSSTPLAGPNPASLWLSYAQREVDLVLVDHEPPPF